MSYNLKTDLFRVISLVLYIIRTKVYHKSQTNTILKNGFTHWYFFYYEPNLYFTSVFSAIAFIKIFNKLDFKSRTKKK